MWFCMMKFILIMLRDPYVPKPTSLISGKKAAAKIEILVSGSKLRINHVKMCNFDYV